MTDAPKPDRRILPFAQRKRPRPVPVEPPKSGGLRIDVTVTAPGDEGPPDESS